ncbi:hypothetical protein CF336_g1845 [Tilletia laevis]|uniref:Glucose and ribitol dehydrogenase n=1 Tax=Tilletia caries TaxID=13290 RepID=A0A177VCE5_9BASI|nr:hypothetical protein CF336_g1845 [Tilletia laevis]KAE8207346.1 hypothetical protein CF335_g1203 [Tilletia laevis]KAE8261573.1 hypothetical protein A4X03_0g3136 [Tilletia caries]
MSAQQFAKDHVPAGSTQDQPRPGLQHKLEEEPTNTLLPAAPNSGTAVEYRAAGKLEGKVALITGGDSGIGRAIAILFALEGCKGLVLSYLKEEQKDVDGTIEIIRKKAPNTRVVAVATDLRKEANARELVQRVISEFGQLDCLCNNAGTQMAVEKIEDLSPQQWRDTFDLNIHGLFYLTQEAVKNMKPGSTIINNASVNHFIGKPELVDYTATKGAIIAFTRALSNQIVGRLGIRVNAVAPGPIWTPLIVATMTDADKKEFGVSTPIGRGGQPSEVATSSVFLASPDSSYISGSTLHPNGGVMTNS